MRDDAGPKGAPEMERNTKPREKKSSDHQLNVLCANLEELYDEKDNADTRDMEAFVARIKDVVAFVPDVLFLQEVVGDVADFVCDRLSRVLGADYSIAVGPGKTPYSRVTGNQEFVRDTAILLNSSTMKMKKQRGYLQTRHDRKDDAEDAERNKVKEHAYILATHKPSKAGIAMMSIHLIPNRWQASKEVGYRNRERWVGQLHKELVEKCGDGTSVRIMAGDFNNPRCMDGKETVDCKPFPFWSVLTEDCGMRDAVFEVHKGNKKQLREQSRRGDRIGRRIDYIFTEREVIDASHDTAYGLHEGEKGFYSDHRLLWATLNFPKGAPRKTS